MSNPIFFASISYIVRSFTFSASILSSLGATKIGVDVLSGSLLFGMRYWSGSDAAHLNKMSWSKKKFPANIVKVILELNIIQ